jgi:hypothetical protein
MEHEVRRDAQDNCQQQPYHGDRPGNHSPIQRLWRTAQKTPKGAWMVLRAVPPERFSLRRV